MPSNGFRSGPGVFAGHGYAPAARPSFYNRTTAAYRGSYPGGDRRNDHGRDRGGRSGYGYGYPGVFASSVVYNPFLFDPIWGFGDPFWDTNAGDAGYVAGADQANADPSYGNPGYADQGAYAQPQQPAAAPQNQQGYSAQPENSYAPSTDTEPGPWAPQRSPRYASTLRQEALVTIVYKDGRPPEHIRNYALTRSALLITGSQMREIPLDDVDLPTTERVNRAAGVDFRLPESY